MYGESATKLIKSITREDGEIIPEYRRDLVDQILKENDELYAENLRISQSVHGDDNVKQDEPSITETRSSQFDDEKEPEIPDNLTNAEKDIMVMQVRHTAKLWNKRCLIAYHFERLNRLKKLRWECGNNLPHEIVKNLSKDELEWFAKYSDNLFSYMSSLNDGQGLDLTLYVTPPKKLYIQVRCVRDYGEFDLEDGQPVMLKKDSIHYLPLSQCEKLIHQGVLEQMTIY